MAHRGQAFRTHHPFVVLSDPDQDAQRVVVLNVTSCKTPQDHARTDVVWPGEHPDLALPSYGAFARAKILPAASLDAAIQGANVTPLQDFPADLLARFCRYAAEAIEVPGEVRGILDSQGLLPP